MLAARLHPGRRPRRTSRSRRGGLAPTALLVGLVASAVTAAPTGAAGPADEARAPSGATATFTLAGGTVAAVAPAAAPAPTPDAAAERGWLGFSAVALKEAGREGGETAAPVGVRVTAVAPSGPAQAAGLRPDDIIVAIDDETVLAPEQLAAALGRRVAGDRVRLVVLRASSPVVLHARLAPAPADCCGPSRERVLGRVVAPPSAASGLSLRFLGDRRRPWLGVAALPLTDQLASYFGADAGVLVETIFPDSPAAAAGVRVGDVVTALGDGPVACPTSLQEALQAHEPGETVRLSIVRDGRELAIDVTLAARAVPTWAASPAPPHPAPSSSGRRPAPSPEDSASPSGSLRAGGVSKQPVARKP